MAKNKDQSRQQGEKQRKQQPSSEKGAEQRPQESETTRERPTPSNLAERSKKQGKKFGHN